MIEIVPHQPDWKDQFLILATTLRVALGNRAVRIDHIGSTAVPGLAAKDVIDIQVTVVALDERIVALLTNAGFEHRPQITSDHVPPGFLGSAEDWTKLFFLQPRDSRRVNLHVRQAGRGNQRYALLFRDYLIAHPHVASAYGELKRRLASSLMNAEDYPEVKDPAVDLIYLAAEQWATQVGWCI